MSKKVASALKSLHTVRRENLQRLVGEGQRFGSRVDLAAVLGVDESYLSQLIGPAPRRKISEITALKFEHKLGLNAGTLSIAV